MKARDLLRGKTEILRDTNVFLDLIKIVKKNYEEPEGFGKITSEYKSCKKQSPEHLSFFNDIAVPDINKSMITKCSESLDDTVSFMNKYLDVDPKGGMYEQLVRRLLDLIEKDQSIDDEEKFRTLPIGSPNRKTELTELNSSHDKPLDICLPVFLLSIWHFILMNRRDTTIGKETYESWHLPQPEGSKAKRVYMGKIGENYQRPLNINIELPVDSDIRSKKKLLFQSKPSIDDLIENELSYASELSNFPNIMPKIINVPDSRVERGFVMNKDSCTKTEEDDYGEIKAILNGQVSQATKDSMHSIVDDEILPQLREMLREPMLHIYDLIISQANGRDEDASSELGNFINFIDSDILGVSASTMMRLSGHEMYDSLLRLREFLENYSRNTSLSAFGNIYREPPYYTQLQEEFESLVMEIFSEDGDA